VYKKALLSQGNREMPRVRLISGIIASSAHAQNRHINFLLPI